MATKDTFKPTTIDEKPFPGQNQVTGNTENSSGEETFYPKEIQPKSFPKMQVASVLKSPSLDSALRSINSNFIFNQMGAISIGTVQGTGTALTGTGIRISPHGIYGYANNPADPTFYVKSTDGSAYFRGQISAGSGLIGGWTINTTNLTSNNATLSSSGQLTLGTSNDVAIMSSVDSTYRLWIGNASAGSASFSVTKAGVVKATGVDISGKLTLGTGSTLSASYINAGTLSADYINGGTLYIGGSADALGIISVKNSSGTEITRLNNNGVIVRNSRGLFFEGTTGSNYWDFQVNGSNEAITSLPSSNKFYLQDYATTTNLFTVSSADGGYLNKQGFIMGNGSSDNTKPRVIKCGTSSTTITADSYGDVTLNFGYTFGTDTPFVVAVCSGTTGTLGSVQEWNVSTDNYSTSSCHAKCRHVNYSTGTGTIYVDWIAIGRTS